MGQGLSTLVKPLNDAEPNWRVIKGIFSLLIIIVALTSIALLIKYAVEKTAASSQTCRNALDTSLTFARASYLSSEGFADMGLSGNKSLYNDLINGLDGGERYLVNVCPFTASLGGYIGTENPGIFHSDFYVQTALRAGIRSFILPISTYIDDNKFPPKWPLSGKPAIVCRDTTGKIISANGLSVKQFCTDVLTYLNENPGQSDEPILIYINQTDNYVPNHITQEKKYVKLMSDIASELDVIPVDRRLVSIGGYGSAVRSANESAILTQVPLTDLKNKFIIFTSFQTKIALKTAYAGITPLLMDYTNFTVQPVIAQNAGLNVAVGNACRSLKIADVSGSKINWSDQARTVWHMTSQDDPLVLPSAATVNAAIVSGIQMIPVPIFMTKDVATVKKIWAQWKGYAWRLKDKDARYLKPEPVQPQAPSAKMNARVSPTAQPGSVAVL